MFVCLGGRFRFAAFWREVWELRGSLPRIATKTRGRLHPVSASLFSPSTPARTVYVTGLCVCRHVAILRVYVVVPRVFPPCTSLVKAPSQHNGLDMHFRGLSSGAKSVVLAPASCCTRCHTVVSRFLFVKQLPPCRFVALCFFLSPCGLQGVVSTVPFYSCSG